MTQIQLFALSATCSLSVLIALAWAKNKPWLWRKSMYLAVCGYAVSAMLFWLNSYSIPDLHPGDFFAGTTVLMLVGITVSYYYDLKAPIIIPDAIMDEMGNHADSSIRIARYQAELLAQQTLVRQRGLWTAVVGVLLIGIAYVIVHMFGLAQNVTGNQEDFSKVLIRLVQKVDILTSKVDQLSDKQDSTRHEVNRNGGRITRIEKRNAIADRRDSLSNLQLLNNQKRMLRKAPARPVHVEPIKVKPWWKIGYQEPIPTRLWDEPPVEY